ncbi:MAG: hypothetical protein IPP90_03130 [Gemmatimonadaceae bacterium]|nr:hypothetical protein [Gemmatimonadaceae bacterium]
MGFLYYAVALVGTIVIEVPIAALFGFRRREELAAVALASVFTYPILSFALAALEVRELERGWYLAALLAFETVVVVTEWKLLVYALRRDHRVLLTSVVMNAVSFLLGLFLMGPQ